MVIEAVDAPRKNVVTTCFSEARKASRLRAGRPLARARCAQSIKSGPTLAAATSRPRRRNAAIKPREITVFPEPLLAAETKKRGYLAHGASETGDKTNHLRREVCENKGSLQYPDSQISAIIPSVFPLLAVTIGGSPFTVARPSRISTGFLTPNPPDFGWGICGFLSFFPLPASLPVRLDITANCSKGALEQMEGSTERL